MATTYSRTCEHDGVPFTSTREHARFCSARCRVAWNRANPRPEAPTAVTEPPTMAAAPTTPADALPPLPPPLGIHVEVGDGERGDGPMQKLRESFHADLRSRAGKDNRVRLHDAEDLADLTMRDIRNAVADEWNFTERSMRVYDELASRVHDTAEPGTTPGGGTRNAMRHVITIIDDLRQRTPGTLWKRTTRAQFPTLREEIDDARNAGERLIEWADHARGMLDEADPDAF